jgi:hypothetical protein
MTEADRLLMLKTDLGFKGTGYDDRLKQILKTSESAIKMEGATTLDVTTLEDAQLVVMYSAWVWRKRDTGEGMPRMLRWSLNNRIFSEKAKVGD